MKILNETGSTALEASAAIAFLVLVLSGGLLSTYVAFARVWISRSAYEGVVCLSSDAEARECEKITKVRIERALPIGQITKLELKRLKKTVSAKIRFQLAGQISIQAREHRKLPLKFNEAHSL